MSTSSSSSDDGSLWFGFKAIKPGHKTSLVKEVFDSVASRYDLMNDLMSLGIHRLWKAALMDQVNPQAGQVLLDVAGGTGDVAFAFLERANKNLAMEKTSARAIVCDINQNMVQVGRDRAINQGCLTHIDWVVGNAENLPMPDRSVDVYTIAFGLRNVSHMDKALAEARRVLKPGGRFFCLEFSQVAIPVLDKLYDMYSFQLLPRLGKWVAGDEDSYRYLVESIRRFPSREVLADRMKQVGLEGVRWRTLSGGIAAIHSAWRL